MRVNVPKNCDQILTGFSFFVHVVMLHTVLVLLEYNALIEKDTKRDAELNLP